MRWNWLVRRSFYLFSWWTAWSLWTFTFWDALVFIFTLKESIYKFLIPFVYLIACRNLRELFKIDAADYMMSICGSAALRELSSPGKSGSVFFLSQDDRFMIKTLRKSEVKVLFYLILKSSCMTARLIVQ